MILKERLLLLRTKMQKSSLDYYYIPSTDPHANEYLPPSWQRSKWLSGFTGSVGHVLIGLKKAYLWTDGRYFLQARKELNPDYFQLMGPEPETATLARWLQKQKKPLSLGVDPKNISIAEADFLKSILAPVDGTLTFITENWIDSLWSTQPALPSTTATSVPEKYTGSTARSKINQVRAILQTKHAQSYLINTLDQIAWLLNIRGKDIPYNPLVISYLLITQEDTILFVDDKKCSKSFRLYCANQNITLHTYAALTLFTFSGTVLIDPKTATVWMRSLLKYCNIVESNSMIPALQAIKNSTEQAGMLHAHKKDGLAIIRFLHWLDNNFSHPINEWEAAEKLHSFRANLPGFQGESFETISAFGKHSAIIHYAPPQENSLLIDNTTLYLLDSGGQYLEGTTDVTRTLHLGTATDIHKKYYTLVLKAHLALRLSRFPKGTTGAQLDGITRRILWEHNIDYPHGTGHGVGNYLCVHESLPNIGPRTTSTFCSGMIVSNEPGVYFPDHYGIRIENLCLVKTCPHSNFLYFEDLTVVPYARNLIEVDLLSDTEKQHINAYHQGIYHSFKSELSCLEQDWLRKMTQPL